MKKNFHQYVRAPLVLFSISLVLFIFSILKGISSFKSQHYGNFSAYIIIFILALVFLFLGIHWCRFDYCERRKK